MEIKNNIENSQEKSFAELLDESLGVRKETEKGNLVSGAVVRIDKDVVFIDLGLKSEGIVPLGEFINKDGEPEIKIGSEVEVLLEKSNSNIPKVSKRKADLFKEREKIEKSFETGEPINAKVIEKIKGGFQCDIGNDIEFRAFLPASQVNNYPNSNIDDPVGKNLEAKIIQNDRNGIVISRKKLLEELREIKRKETLSTLDEGKIISAEVVNIIDQGVFADLNGVNGFIPISELSWGRVKHPTDVVSLKQYINVKVLRIEDEGNRITLSIKQTQPDPWETVKEKYKPGSKVKGKVVTTKDFGVFVELEPGVQGLIHVSELSWTKNFRHPKEIIETDSPVEVVVIDTNLQDKKLSLSLRQIEPSPWQVFKNNNPKGTKIKGKIKNINEHGLFIEVAESIVGLVRPENINWQGKVNPVETYDVSKLGQEIEVVVLNVEPKQNRIALGIKQLSEDPWELARKNYKPGETALNAKINEVTNSGFVVELENEIEGFFKLSDVNNDRNQELQQTYKTGDEITGLVVGFDRNKRRINLSKNRLDQKLERERLSDFISSQGDTSEKLGDILSEQLKSIEE